MEPIIDLKELQKIEYRILEAADRYFSEHGLKYMLAYGTMLGAVRHNGFIPWDDDIDIFMFRDDYEKLKQMAEKDIHITSEIVIRTPGSSGFVYPFIKIVDLTTRVYDEMLKENIDLQVWIDVFPLDHLPDSDDASRTILNKCKKYRRLLNIGMFKVQGSEAGVKSSLKKTIFYLLGGCEGTCRFIDSYGKNCNKKYIGSNTFGNIVWAQYGKDFFSKSMLLPTKQHTFEQGLFYIPEKFDDHLRYMYDDYMKLPPEDKRARHFITAYKILGRS